MKTIVYFDPLPLLTAEAGCTGMTFSRLVFGEKYCAVMLSDGRCGVCATLGIAPPANLPAVFTPDFGTPAGRVITQATVNAVFNLHYGMSDNTDIGAAILASGFRSMVMIGYFCPLVAPLREAGVGVTIFDPAVDQSMVSPPEQLPDAIAGCHLLMVTATSITNNTFGSIMEHVADGTEVWLVGPSTPLSPLMFSQYPVTRLFGTRFAAGNHALLNLVEEGHGTRGFNRTGDKVMIVS